MAFERESTRTPTSIGRITIHFAQLATGQPVSEATADIEVLDAVGRPFRIPTYDLLANIGDAQKTTLLNIVNAVRTKAEAEIL